MTRRIEKSVELPVLPAEAWRVLASAEALTSWFPLEARLDPRPGGEIWLSWGEGCAMSGRVELFEPESRLRFQQEIPTPGGAIQLAVDFHIEARGDGCVMRLVHSGFGAQGWEDELESLERGWTWFLLQLRHYLALHAGRRRRWWWAKAVVPRAALTAEQAWARLIGPNGLGLETTAPVSGGPYALRTATGDALRGAVVHWNAPFHFAGSLPDHHDALFLCEVEPGSEHQVPSILLSSWTADPTLDDLGARLGALVQDLFPEGQSVALGEVFDLARDADPG